MRPITTRSVLGWILLLAGLACVSCNRQATGVVAAGGRAGVDPEVTARGSIEVSGRLEEIPEGAIFRRGLYHYATVLKYRVLEVHRGKVPGETIYVAHYDPFKPRSEAADERAKGIGGDLKSFHDGQVHRMALEEPVEDHFMGGMVNKYFGKDTGTIYWAVWTNLVSE
jgi:hypothetical protein